eukprot:6144085-Pleurochrysis_carterae.AAC.2
MRSSGGTSWGEGEGWRRRRDASASASSKRSAHVARLRQRRGVERAYAAHAWSERASRTGASLRKKARGASCGCRVPADSLLPRRALPLGGDGVDVGGEGGHALGEFGAQRLRRRRASKH